MGKRRYLTGKQLAIIDDMFTGEFDEQQLQEKHNVRTGTFKRWQNDAVFMAEVDRRVMAAHLQGAALIARYSQVAAAKLVELTESKNAETARKACLDIMGFPFSKRGQTSVPTAGPTAAEQKSPAADEQLSPEAAGRILAVLAEEGGSD